MYSSLVFLRTGHLAAPCLVHAYCNFMGFPDFMEVGPCLLSPVSCLLSPVSRLPPQVYHSPPRRRLLLSSMFVAGAAGFYLLLPWWVVWVEL